MRVPTLLKVVSVVIASCTWVAACTGSVGGGGSAGGTSPAGSTPATPGHRPTTPVGGDRVGIGGTIAGAATGVKTALPSLPALQGVSAKIIGDSVDIDFSPIDGAKDYRVYLLPDDGDITAADGHVSVKNGTYRCGGERPAPLPNVDAISHASAYVATLVDNQKVDGYTRSKAEATLGYVYTTPASDRMAVYALGDSSPKGDNGCYWARWQESRAKKYTTSSAERTMLISQRWRDDGIAFYVPMAGGVPVFTSTNSDNVRFYYVDGPESAVRTGGTTAFNVVATAGPDTAPLMRVYYANNCGYSHDELVAGNARFDRAYHQNGLPTWGLHWSGLTQHGYLVVEALDDLCPWPGMLAPMDSPAYTSGAGDMPEWITPDTARKASPTGELFINGQGTGTNPKPVARSFIEVTPTTPTNMDWYEGFVAPMATLAANPDCGATGGNSCWEQFRSTSSAFDVSFFFVEDNRHAISTQFGELWTGYADVGGDVGAKYRIMPKTQAKMDANSFLYINMNVDSFTSGRRYPQIVVSDQTTPIDWNFTNGNSLVVQTFASSSGTASWPNQYMLEVCDHRQWNTDDQCPAFHDLHEILDPNDATKVVNLSPAVEVEERAGLDRSSQWEVYASTTRAYLFFDGQPYGCVNLPSSGVPTGTVNVFFGDVLYHSGVDDMTELSTFLKAHGQTETHRHFDNLAFKNGVAAPPWNEAILPCALASQMK